jgi:hypothetical protein
VGSKSFCELTLDFEELLGIAWTESIDLYTDRQAILRIVLPADVPDKEFALKEILSTISRSAESNDHEQSLWLGGHI